MNVVRFCGSSALFTMFITDVILIFTAALFSSSASATSCTFDNSKAEIVTGSVYSYVIYNADVSLGEARCLCESLPETRLAVFDDRINMDDVTQYFNTQQSSYELWLDAERELGFWPVQRNYMWGNNCSLLLSSSRWKSGEPGDSDVLVRLKKDNGDWTYWGTKDTSGQRYKPLCQSAKPPLFDYAPTLPVLKWVSLGNVGHMFGFSDEIEALEDARNDCEHQPGNVYLATLDHLYDEVATYVSHNYPDRGFWLDTVSNDSMETVNMTFDWATGGSVNNSYIINTTASLVMLKANDAVHLVQSSEFLQSYLICEGFPETVWSSTHNPLQLEWVQLGSYRRYFGFSKQERTFEEAKIACANQRGRTRLAVLDTMFAEVAEWIKHNDANREFWVYALRPEFAASSDFLWGNGLRIDPSVWESGEPGSDDWVGRLKKDNGDIRLAGTTSYNTQRRFVCEEVPEVTLQWYLLGSPGKLFGFSRTASWGVDWARTACASQPGSVSLANLDTHFDAVVQFMHNHFPRDQFWVDAILQPQGSKFVWSNGVEVDPAMWVPSEPTAGDTVVRLRQGFDPNSNVIGLAATSGPENTFYFLCEGRPTRESINVQLPSPCVVEEPEVQTTPVVTTVAETTTESPTECPDCICNTTEHLRTFNLSMEEVQQLTRAIKKRLSVDKSKLSATIRKVTSAEDSRPSAQATGSIGIIMILIPFIFIVGPDVVTFSNFAMKKIKKLKMKRMKRRLSTVSHMALEEGQTDNENTPTETDMTVDDLDDVNDAPDEANDVNDSTDANDVSDDVKEDIQDSTEDVGETSEVSNPSGSEETHV